MAVDAYMSFLNYNNAYLKFESQVEIITPASDPLSSGLPGSVSSLKDLASQGYVCEVDDYSFDIEQTLNIGSQSSGAGAGKVTFNAFTINRSIDRASPPIFAACCAGVPFKMVHLFLRKSSGQGAEDGKAMAGVTFVRFDFKLAAIKTIGWSHDDTSPKEAVSFEYGALLINYALQSEKGLLQPMQTEGWNRVLNKQDRTPADFITTKASTLS